LKRLTDAEQETLDELNKGFISDSLQTVASWHHRSGRGADEDEYLAAIEERMKRLKLLMMSHPDFL
jgi:hypothetical protein